MTQTLLIAMLRLFAVLTAMRGQKTTHTHPSEHHDFAPGIILFDTHKKGVFPNDEDAAIIIRKHALILCNYAMRGQWGISQSRPL